MIKIYCLDNDKVVCFNTANKRKAVENLLKYLNNTIDYDKNAVIKETERCITLVHNGLTYACKK